MARGIFLVCELLSSRTLFQGLCFPSHMDCENTSRKIDKRLACPIQILFHVEPMQPCSELVCAWETPVFGMLLELGKGINPVCREGGGGGTQTN